MSLEELPVSNYGHMPTSVDPSSSNITLDCPRTTIILVKHESVLTQPFLKEGSQSATRR